jgi:hypothetical protein
VHAEIINRPLVKRKSWHRNVIDLVSLRPLELRHARPLNMSQQRNDYRSIQGGTVLAGVVLNTDGGPVIIGGTQPGPHFPPKLTNSEDSSHSRDDQCLRDLRGLTDPRDDKVRIEWSKDDLLRDSWAWILNDKDFISWRDCDETQLL